MARSRGRCLMCSPRSNGANDRPATNSPAHVSSRLTMPDVLHQIVYGDNASRRRGFPVIEGRPVLAGRAASEHSRHRPSGDINQIQDWLHRFTVQQPVRTMLSGRKASGTGKAGRGIDRGGIGADRLRRNDRAHHAIRHDRAKEHGAYATPPGRPRKLRQDAQNGSANRTGTGKTSTPPRPVSV
jgi:hypothetical protein